MKEPPPPLPNHVRCHVLVPEGISIRQSLIVSFSSVSKRHSTIRPSMSHVTTACHQRSVLQMAGFIELWCNTHTALSRGNMIESELFHCEGSANDVKLNMGNEQLSMHRKVL
jgi:hypothetical protein